jgi:DeoR family glycerol-3-phosphate regulon repressor
MSQVDIFVTDRAPPEAIAEVCRHSGVQIEITGGNGETDRAEEARPGS